MTISSKCKEVEEKEKDYPKLVRYKGISSLIILLLTSERSGTILVNQDYDSLDHWPVGYHSDSWNPNNFEDYKGEVTLKNQ